MSSEEKEFLNQTAGMNLKILSIATNSCNTSNFFYGKGNHPFILTNAMKKFLL